MNGREIATVRLESVADLLGEPADVLVAAGGDEAQLHAVGVAAERHPPGRGEEADLSADLLAAGPRGLGVVLGAGLALASEEHDPRRAGGWHRLCLAGSVRGTVNGLVPCELERQQAGDARQRHPGELADRLRAEHHEGARGTGRGRQRDAQRDGALGGLRLVPGRVRRGPWRLGWRVDDERGASTCLERQCTAEEAGHGTDERGDAPALQRAAPKLRLQQRRLPLQLRPAGDDEADDAPLQLDRIGPLDADGRDARRRERLGRALLRVDEQDPGNRHGGEGSHQVPKLGCGGRHHGKRGRGRDHEVARLQGVERRHARPQHAHPGDRPTGTLAGDPRRSGQQLRGEAGEVRHAGAARDPAVGDPAVGAPRAVTSASTRPPNSRSKST